MKKFLCFLFFTAALHVAAHAQVFKLVPVFEDKVSHTYLSFHKNMEENPGENPVFSLWGFQRYDESWIIAYEVEYLQAEAKEMFRFLNEVVDFAEKYQSEDGILTYISGVKVKTFKYGRVEYTRVFDTESKVCCQFRHKDWSQMLDDFKTFCENNSLQYQD